MSKSKCIIPGCGTSGKMARELGISFHEIPCSTIRERWLEIINLPNVKAEAKVCSVHFEEDDFRSYVKKRSLKPSAIPSLFVKQQPNSMKTSAHQDGSDYQLVFDLKSEAVTSSTAKAQSIPILAFVSSPSDVLSQDIQGFQLSSISNDSTTEKSDSSISELKDKNSTVNKDSVPEAGAVAVSNFDESSQDAEKATAVHSKTETIFCTTSGIDLNTEEYVEGSRICSAQVVEISNSSQLTKSLPLLNIFEENSTTSIAFIEVHEQAEKEEQGEELFSEEVLEDTDHCYSLLPSYLDKNTETKESSVSSKKDTWSGPEAYNQAMDAKEKQMLSIENSILKRKICGLNLQHKKSLSSLKNENINLRAKLQSSLNLYKNLKKATCESVRLANRLHQVKADSTLVHQFAKIEEDAKDQKKLKANFLLDQIKMYDSQKTCFSAATFQLCKNWFEAAPDAYKHFTVDNYLVLPSEKILREFIRPCDDLLDMTRFVHDMLLKERKKINQKEIFVTLHVSEVKIEDSDEVYSRSAALSLFEDVTKSTNGGIFTAHSKIEKAVDENLQPPEVTEEKSNTLFEEQYFQCEHNVSCGKGQSYKHLVAFVLKSLTSSFRIPCGFYPMLKVNEAILSNLTKTVIKDVEKMGFSVVRLVTSLTGRTSLLFKELGVQEFPHIVHPNDPSRMLFVSYDSDEIVKEICEKFAAFALQNSDESVKVKVLSELQKLQSTEAINPASHFLLCYLKKRNVKGINMLRRVEVFSDPIIVSLAELKVKNAVSHFCNHEFFEMLERWHSIENILHASENFNNKEKITSVKDERIIWLQDHFGEYLESVKQGKLRSVILSLHQELLDALILCNLSTSACLQYLVKTKNYSPTFHNNLLKCQNSLKNFPMKRPNCETLERSSSAKCKRPLLSSSVKSNEDKS